MLQKSKSKQIKLLKYALLIPMVLAMLAYTSGQGQNIDLSQYTFSVGVTEGLTDRVKQNIEKHDTFLKANADKYVSWVEVEWGKQTNFSIHSINEKIPDGYRELTSKADNYKSYVTFKDTDDSTNQKALSQLAAVKGKPLFVTITASETTPANIEVPFAVIEEIPVFPGCDTLQTRDQKRDCVSKTISTFVGKNFNTKLADSLNLKGIQRISIMFKIDTLGNVSETRARAPHPALEAEAKRVVSALPKMFPGKQRGKAVTVPYALPIVFKVADEDSEGAKE